MTRPAILDQTIVTAADVVSSWDDVRKYVEWLEVEEKCDKEYLDLIRNKYHSAKDRISELEKRLADAERVIRGLLYCPVIADGEQNDPSWGCEETAEAERAARAYMEGK